MLPTASCLSRLAWLPPLCLLSMDDYHLIVVPSRLWFCLRLWLPESSPLSVSLNVATLLSHLWSHPFPDSHSLAVTVDWTVWILLLPKCPRLDCLTWCTGLYLWLKFLILRTWRYKRNDCVCIFFLRWHNRNTTKIYYSLFLVQILFLVSSVNLGKQWWVCIRIICTTFSIHKFLCSITDLLNWNLRSRMFLFLLSHISLQE